jgi:hypothetical protein
MKSLQHQYALSFKYWGRINQNAPQSWVVIYLYHLLKGTFVFCLKPQNISHYLTLSWQIIIKITVNKE